MKILTKQAYHLIFLSVLLTGVYFLSRGMLQTGYFRGLSTREWFWISIWIPIVHQIYVVILWRSELHYHLLTKWFGKRGFTVWAVGFIILFLARPVSIIGLAVSNRDTLDLPLWLVISLSAVCLGVGIYLVYSVLRYFGINRAMGMDHFQPDIYRKLPFVKGGIFRWSSNSMYLFGFLLFWVPGLILLSRAALVSALFNHLYIWAHYFFTEYPDMQHIYNI